MEIIQSMVIGSASADKVQLCISKRQVFQRLNASRFTELGEQTLFSNPIAAYVPKRNLGSTRIANEDETLSLVEGAMHFQQNASLAYLASIPLNELSGLTIHFLFLPYSKDVKIATHLTEMLSFLELTKVGSRSGKIDYTKLEQQFSRLIKPKEVIDYIPQARKHSYLKVLGGKNNANA